MVMMRDRLAEMIWKDNDYEGHYIDWLPEADRIIEFMKKEMEELWK